MTKVEEARICRATAQLRLEIRILLRYTHTYHAVVIRHLNALYHVLSYDSDYLPILTTRANRI